MKRRSIFVNGIIIAVAGCLCLFLYSQMVPHNRSAVKDQIADSIGLTVILLGQYLRISARGYKSERHIEKTVLLTEGPYAFVRNPMYLASFLIGLGLVILLLDLWMIPVYGGFFLLWYWPQIHDEQEWLVKRFGQEYIDYCKTTPCFLPRLRALVSFKAKTYIPLKTVWIKKEWNTIFIWSLVAVVVEGYQDITSFSFAVFAKEFAFLLLILFYFTAFAILFRAD